MFLLFFPYSDDWILLFPFNITAQNIEEQHHGHRLLEVAFVLETFPSNNSNPPTDLFGRYSLSRVTISIDTLYDMRFHVGIWSLKSSAVWMLWKHVRCRSPEPVIIVKMIGIYISEVYCYLRMNTLHNDHNSRA